MQPGVDTLARSGFRALAGRRVALLTHDAGRDVEGRRTIDVLAAAPEVELVRILSPEHGLGSRLEGDVGDAVDARTGLPVFSLYGTNRRPSDEMLVGIDALVVDLQDVGVRFYTYATTLGYAMEEAGARGIGVVVLDRPNPLGGDLVDGPAADPDRRRFICYRPLPLVHGLTIGELALLFTREYGVACEVEVVRCEGWRRAMRWEDTGLVWVAPSPNLRTPSEAHLYPVLGLLEATNVSVGRGTPTPFEVLGAPWIDGPRLAEVLSAEGLDGLRFFPTDFVPRSGPFAGERCRGVRLVLEDSRRLEPARTGLAIAWWLARLHGAKFQLGRVLERLDSARVQALLERAQRPRDLPDAWREDVRRFRLRRAGCLLYR